MDFNLLDAYIDYEKDLKSFVKQISRFLKRAIGRRAEPRYGVPAGRRIYAVGDVHGRVDLLTKLLAKIDDDNAGRAPEATTLVFLGDLVDRGPHSAQVVQTAIQLTKASDQVHVIRGNHEEAMLAALDGNMRAFKFFLMYGGDATLRSYGVSDSLIASNDLPNLLRAFVQSIPSEHVAFLQETIDYLEIGNYFFTHAGVRPGVALSDQSPFDLRWIRDPFLGFSRNYSKLIIHGHTPSDEVQIRSNRIGIDTGAFESGRLTALALEGADRWFLQT